ncbi:hypothetical protein HaLaN_21291 [Haematococcus lacustris]|uniref:Uncharacterized protein n=1 Tax=Haematococcus lacustris TaxID=44745 RepID=A0A699ZLI1_HAELA|nr:hypothetical protein HaLaN_21291 [Haematococcus lacustris]
MDAGGSLEESEQPRTLSQPCKREMMGIRYQKLQKFSGHTVCISTAGSLKYIAIASRGSYEHTSTLGRKNKSNT